MCRFILKIFNIYWIYWLGNSYENFIGEKLIFFLGMRKLIKIDNYKVNVKVI